MRISKCKHNALTRKTADRMMEHNSVAISWIQFHHTLIQHIIDWKVIIQNALSPANLTVPIRMQDGKISLHPRRGGLRILPESFRAGANLAPAQKLGVCSIPVDRMNLIRERCRRKIISAAFWSWEAA